MFISPEFWLFTAVVLVLYYRVEQRAQNVLLLVASTILYAYFDWQMLPVLLLTTAFTTWTAHRVGPGKRYRRQLLFTGILINAAVLIGFKIMVADASLVLPLGLSFYTFRNLSYLLDVYGGRVSPGSWLDSAVYTSFFPQITAGPIERAARFLPALKARRQLGREQVGIALTYLLIGLFYKVVIADPLAAFTDQAFSNVYLLSAPNALAAMVAFGVRLYADFAGYSALAIGVSRLFGLPAMGNFRQPYFAQSVTEFWTRWHISLSTWFRDYVFFPLTRFALRRVGRRFAFAVETGGLLITMLLIGLWHGLALPFVVWGALHTAYMTVERILNRRDPSFNAADLQAGKWQRRVALVGSIAVTQIAVAAGWIIFRLATLADTFTYFQRLLTPSYSYDGVAATHLLVPLIMLIAFDLIQVKGRLIERFWYWPVPFRVAFVSAVALLCFVMATAPHGVFIYAQF